MRRIATLAVGLAVLLAACSGDTETNTTDGPATSDPAATEGTAAGDQMQLVAGSITAGVVLVGDIAREFLVAIPPDYDPAVPAPLIFDLHGRGGSAPDQARGSGMTDAAWPLGFVVVHPQAGGEVPTWSVWPELPELDADIAFFEMMIETISSELSIDQDRIFVTGFSNGGGMAGRLACELPDLIRAIAPVGASNEGWLQCDPGRPVPVLAFHGYEDEIIPFDGGQALLPAMPEWAAWWAESNGCGAGTGPIQMATGDFWHWECDGVHTVSLIALDGLGHDWPRQVQTVAQGDGVSWVGASEIIVDFFASL